MEITLQYFDDCPNWKTTAAHLATLVDQGLDATVDFELIDTNRKPVKLSDFKGKKNVVLAFYVLAFTGG